MKYIPLVTSSEENIAEENALRSSIDKLRSEIGDLKKQMSIRLVSTDKKSGMMIQEVKESRETIDVALNNQEVSAIANIEQWQTDITTRVEKDLNACNDIENDISDIESGLANSSTDKHLHFARIKLGKVLVSDISALISNMLGSDISDTARLECDTGFIDIIDQQGLWHLMTGDAPQNKASGKGQGQLKRRLNVPYSVHFISDIRVKMLGDNKCNIWSMCQMTGGDIVLADNANKCLKRLLFDKSYKILGHCTLPAQPRGVCSIDQHELAVTLANQTIQFATVRPNMTLGRSIPTKHDCSGLTYVDGALYVTEYRGPHVFVYDLAGTLLRFVLIAPTTDRPIFSNTKFITPRPDGQALFVTDWDRGLVTIGLDGTRLGDLDLGEIKNACDVCIDDKGHVFLCGHRSHNIIQVDYSGSRKLSDIACRGETMSPQALCFDRKSSCLLVASLSSDALRVLHLSQ